MSTTYRCTKMAISELFDTFYIGRRALDELNKHMLFENEHGCIRINRDDFQDVFYITITIKSDNNIRSLPYLYLIDELESTCLRINNKYVNDGKYTYTYHAQDDLNNCFSENIFIPTLMLKDI